MNSCNRALLASLLALCSTSTGCSDNPPANSRIWTYSFAGDIKNLEGCNDASDGNEEVAFLVPIWNVLRRTDSEIVVVFYTDNPPTSLLLAYKAPGGNGAGQRAGDTGAGTLRAWLVRRRSSAFNDNRKSLHLEIDYNPMRVVDFPGLLAIADGHAAPEDAHLAFPLAGTSTIITDEARITRLSLDVRTAKPIEPYEDDLRWSIELFRNEEKAGRGSNRVRGIIEYSERCLRPHPLAPATIKGEFRGRWERTDLPPVL